LRESEGTDLQPCKAVHLLKILSVTITDEANRNDERKETGQREEDHESQRHS
jgi:hypothetical protein